jgi:hypothetical protein
MLALILVDPLAGAAAKHCNSSYHTATLTQGVNKSKQK